MHRLLLGQQRDLRFAHGLAGGLRARIDLLLHEWRQHPAGADRVAGNAVIGRFDGHHLGHADNAVLGGDVGNFLRARHQAVRRGDIDDAAPLALLHAGDRGANAVKRRRQVDGYHRVPFVDREILDAGDMLNAGIVDQHVERAEFFFGGRDHRRDFRGLGHVGRRIKRLDAEFLFEARALLLDRVLVAETVEHDIGAVGGQRPRGGQPDAGGGTGDQSRFAFEHESPLVRAAVSAKGRDVGQVTPWEAC